MPKRSTDLALHRDQPAAMVDHRHEVRSFQVMISRSRRSVRSDPGVMGRTLVFRATRVPAQSLLDDLDDGFAVYEFLEMFPSVNREDAEGFLRLVRGEADAGRP
jgi:uncharacterized protein (DUF433 family)